MIHNLQENIKTFVRSRLATILLFFFYETPLMIYDSDRSAMFLDKSKLQENSLHRIAGPLTSNVMKHSAVEA